MTEFLGDSRIKKGLCYHFSMDAIGEIVRMLLSFLLKILELFVGFIIQVLTLVVDFARSVVSLVI